MAHNNLKKVLTIGRTELKTAKELRRKSILLAIALKGGASQQEKVFHPMWHMGGFEVGVAKPGKEADPKRKMVNPNDMWPYIKERKKLKTESATFKDISIELEHMANKSPWSLELLGCLFVRSAFMLDHSLNGEKIVYTPPDIVIDEIKKDITNLFKVPIGVFLQYGEMIALNEDVKYYTRGLIREKSFGSGAGRQNNLLSAAHLIAVLLHRASIVDFSYGFSMMRGVSPLSIKKAKICFPLLDGEGLG